MMTLRTLQTKYNMWIYTVTVLDLSSEQNVLGFQKTPAIFTTFKDAVFAVKNNLSDLSDSGLYQYAVIEKNKLNEIRPLLEDSSEKQWFKYNSALDEFESCKEPIRFCRVTGFGIG